jgi:hypothetical protein
VRGRGWSKKLMRTRETTRLLVTEQVRGLPQAAAKWSLTTMGTSRDLATAGHDL